MQFMNSSLEVLAKNFSDNDFKHLSPDFSGNLLKFIKQKGVYLFEYMDSLSVLKIIYLIDLNFIVL